MAVRANQEALVLKSPFELYEHRFASELLHEWLGVYRIDLWPFPLKFQRRYIKEIPNY